MSIEARLAELGITLPPPMAAVANYLPFVVSGNLISVSGQIPKQADGSLITGKLGHDMDVPAGKAAARQCAINIVAQVKAAIGDLDRVARIVKLGGFVNGTDDFTDHPLVINGASDLMVEIFGDKGRHSRSAVGVNGLPLGVAVEVDALVQFDG